MFESVFDQVSILGIPLIIITLGIVEASKRLGVSGKWLLIESIAVGSVFYSAHYLSGVYPAVSFYLNLVVYGLGGGLATSGIFDFVNKRLPAKE
jgi:hypothetical protein